VLKGPRLSLINFHLRQNTKTSPFPPLLFFSPLPSPPDLTPQALGENGFFFPFFFFFFPPQVVKGLMFTSVIMNARAAIVTTFLPPPLSPPLIIEGLILTLHRRLPLGGCGHLFSFFFLSLHPGSKKLGPPWGKTLFVVMQRGAPPFLFSFFPFFPPPFFWTNGERGPVFFFFKRQESSDTSLFPPFSPPSPPSFFFFFSPPMNRNREASLSLWGNRALRPLSFFFFPFFFFPPLFFPPFT